MHLASDRIRDQHSTNMNIQNSIKKALQFESEVSHPRIFTFSVHLGSWERLIAHCFEITSEHCVELQYWQRFFFCFLTLLFYQFAFFFFFIFSFLYRKIFAFRLVFISLVGIGEEVIRNTSFLSLPRICESRTILFLILKVFHQGYNRK